MKQILTFHRTYFFLMQLAWSSASGGFWYRLRYTCYFTTAVFDFYLMLSTTYDCYTFATYDKFLVWNETLFAVLLPSLVCFNGPGGCWCRHWLLLAANATELMKSLEATRLLLGLAFAPITRAEPSVTFIQKWNELAVQTISRRSLRDDRYILWPSSSELRPLRLPVRVLELHPRRPDKPNRKAEVLYLYRIIQRWEFRRPISASSFCGVALSSLLYRLSTVMSQSATEDGIFVFY